MRAVDTNVIVRYFMGDDSARAVTAKAIIGEEPVFMPRTAVLKVE